MRKEGPMLLSIVAAAIMIFSKYFSLGQQWRLDSTWGNWFLISMATGIGVGFINLALLHYKNVVRRTRKWWASVVVLVIMFPYLALIIYEDVTGPHVTWFLDGVTRPIGSTIFAMLAFFIFSAAYRAFRIKTIESSLLLVAAFVAMMGTAPIGGAIFPPIEAWRQWLFDVVVTGSYRSITVGAFLGAYAVAIRILLGLERAHLAAGGE